MIKNLILIGFVLITFCSCGCNENELSIPVVIKEPGTLYSLRPVNLLKSYNEDERDSIQVVYNEMINEIISMKYDFATRYEQTESDSIKKEILEQAKKYMISIISDEVLPKWYGTDWEFEGHTNVPLEGAIACGYFVSTPLKHIGFNMNRYRMAQKYSHDIIKSLCDSNLIMVFNKEVLGEKLIDISNRKDDIYIVGLDCHVGFLINTDHKLRFVHSNYMYPVRVVEEDVYESEAFLQSELYVVGSLFGSENFIIKWLNNDTIK